MDIIDSVLDALAEAIAHSSLKPEILGAVAGGRSVQALDPVLSRAFRRLGYVVGQEVDSPWVRAWRKEHPQYRFVQQRADYLLKRDRRAVAVAELESLDRAQMMTFKCQYYDWDSGKRDYYWATVDHLVAHPEVPRLDFFLFVLVLPDFPVERYTVWDTSDEYYEVSRADRRMIYRSPYKFYDHRIKRLLREMLVNKDPEATLDENWAVQGRRLADLQDVCELLVVTITGPELVLARGRDLLARSKETRRPVRWAHG